MNKLLSRLSDLVNVIGKSWANDASAVDFKEIERMRSKLTRMRFSKPSMEIEIPLQAQVSADSCCGSLRGNFANLSLRARDRQSIKKWFAGSEPIDLETQLRETIQDMAKSRQKQMDEAQEHWQFMGIQEEYPRIGYGQVDPAAEAAVARFLSAGCSEDNITPPERRIGVDHGSSDIGTASDGRQLPAVIESLEHSMSMNAVEEPVYTVIEDEADEVSQTHSSLADSLNDKVVPLRTVLKSANRWRHSK